MTEDIPKIPENKIRGNQNTHFRVLGMLTIFLLTGDLEYTMELSYRIFGIMKNIHSTAFGIFVFSFSSPNNKQRYKSGSGLTAARFDLGRGHIDPLS